MIKTSLIIILTLILIIPSAFSDIFYNETGTSDNDFIAGNGLFNAQLTTDTTTQRTLTDGRMHPIVSDLDGDGINEIIVLDGGNIRLFQDSSLDVVDSFLLSGSTFSNFVAFDIDDDDFTEIIVAELDSNRVNILEYNGTAIVSQITLTLETEIYEEAIIKCGATDNCLVLATSILGNFISVSAYNFSSTGIGARNSFRNSTDGHCLPIIPSMSFKDYDNDGESEYIMSYIFVSGTASPDENVFIYYFNLSAQLERTIDLNADNTPILAEDMGNIITLSSSPPDCDNSGGTYDDVENPPARFLTSPLVFDLDGSSSNGLETVVGFMIDADEFVMEAFNSDGSFLDEFPEVLDADGIIISNPIVTNVFSDSGDGQDFCVLGFQSTTQQIDLLCGSKLRTGFGSFEADEFFFSTEGLFNVTIAFRDYNVMIHSVQHTTQTPNNINEILTTYGVFTVDDDNDALNRIFSITNPGLSCIQADAEKIGTDDLICSKSTQLVYIDDGLSNQPAIITNIEFNPCIDSVIKVNSTMQVVVTVTDQNNEALGQDLVSSIVEVYESSPDQLNSSIFNVSSDSEMAHQFILNATGVGRNIKIQGFDSIIPRITDTKEFPFTVSNTGVEFGDCASSFSFITVEEEAEVTEATLTIDATENAVTSGIEGLSGISNLAGTTIWFILMLAFSTYIWFAGAERGFTGNSTLGTIAIVNTLFIIIGARVGIISTGLVVIIVALGVVIIGVFLGKFLTGIRTEGGL